MRAANRLSRCLASACALCALLVGMSAAAATFKVDDTGTVVSEPVVNMRWRQLVPGRGANHQVEATVRVDVRLNLTQWQRKPARIYMGLAPSPGDRVFAQWRSQGRLLPGSMHSGGRALVFDGIVTSATLTESLVLTLETDGRNLNGVQLLDFYFEIEVSP